MLKLVDAVQVVRHADGRIKVKPLRNLTGIAAMGGAIWGYFSARSSANTSKTSVILILDARGATCAHCRSLQTIIY